MHADDKRDGQLASVKNDYLTRGLIALGSAPLQSESFLRRLRAETNAFNPIESVKPSRHVDGDLVLRRRQGARQGGRAGTGDPFSAELSRFIVRE